MGRLRMLRNTPLHRLLGQEPGRITDELLDAAVSAKVAETDDLDWKSEAPASNHLADSDFPKDVAAMANSGGGVIVYGITEKQKKAEGRKDVGGLTEQHERALRAVAYSSIKPPVLGLAIYVLGDLKRQALVVEVPASTEGPHLIFKNQFFGAPIRNNADTAWMTERQIETAYRARFEERRHIYEAITSLYAEAATNWGNRELATFVAIAHPRIPLTSSARPTRERARDEFQNSTGLTLTFSKNTGTHPLTNVETSNPRPGLRRWVAASTSGVGQWKSAWAAVHDDGSVSLAATVGGHPISGRDLSGYDVNQTALECAVVDFMAIVRAVSESRGTSEYELRLGIESPGESPLEILNVGETGSVHRELTLPIHSFTPIMSTVTADVSLGEFHKRVQQLAVDCINQGGLTNLNAVRNPPDEA
jgi:hypothetical protein